MPRSTGVPSRIHFVPETVTSGEEDLTRRETGSRHADIAVTGKSITRIRTGRSADASSSTARSGGYEFAIICTDVMPYEAASRA